MKKVHKNGDKIVKVDVEAQPAAEADKVCVLKKRQKITLFFSQKHLSIGSMEKRPMWPRFVYLVNYLPTRTRTHIHKVFWPLLQRIGFKD